MLPMVYTVVGESRAQAEEREQVFLNDLVDPMASLTLLSELMNYDFSGLELDAPITDELIASVSASAGWSRTSASTSAATPSRSPTWPATGPRCSRDPVSSAPGTEVADQMEEWFETEACDGFVVAATHSPGAYEDVVRLVVPELQRRGVFRDRYTGSTLRDNLGLARPRAERRMADEPRAAPRAAGRRGGHPGRRTDGRHRPRRVRCRGHQGGAARAPAIRCAPGATGGTASASCGRA